MLEKIKAAFRAATSYRVRGYIYGVALAAVPVGIYKGWMEPELAPLAVALLLALLKLSPDAPKE